MRTPHTAPTRKTRTDRAPRLRVTPEVIGDLVERLTPRDRQILHAVWDHRVLTTDQLTRMFFNDPRRTRRRLTELHRLAALERRQPWTPQGSAQLHWVLGPSGAHVIAADEGVNLKTLGYQRTATTKTLLSPKLSHHIGTNEFFVSLLHTARTRGNGELLQWRSERQCAKLWGDLARPDAHGHWAETQPDGTPAEIDFFLEYDNGTVPFDRVASKMAGYAELAESTGITTIVLFSVHSTRREAGLRARLETDPACRTVPVATAHRAPAGGGLDDDGPAGPRWLPLHTTRTRYRLAALADHWGGYIPRPQDPGGRG